MKTPCFATGYLKVGVLLILLLAPCLLLASETREYVYLTNGTVTGGLTMTKPNEQFRQISFEYKDRGRGPAIEEKISLGSHGELTGLEITGHSYMGAPVDEHFELTDGNASWTSTLEKGSVELSGEAMYMAADGSVEQLAILVRQAMLQADRRLSLLPSGSATVRPLGQLSVENEGTSQAVFLYEVSGLDLEPDYIWLDEDQQLFAVGYGSEALVLSGWEEVMPELQARIDEAQDKFLQRLSTELTQELPSTYAISPVQLLDVDSGELLPGRTVVVKDGMVADISTQLPTGFKAKVIDGKNQVLMPGLWDMHTHLRASSGLLHVAAGVTTARDLGNIPDRLDVVRQRFDSGEVIGPHVFAAGIVDGKSPYSAPIDRLAGSQKEAVELVDYYAARGYPQIKIYSSADPAWISAVTTRAHANDMRVSGHVPAFMTAQQAVDNGYDEIQHINMLFLNFLAGPDDDTRTPVRFTLVAEKAGSMDLDAPQVQAFVELLAQQQIVIDPTVAIFDNMFRHRSGELSPSFAMVAERMPPSVRRGFLAGRMDVNDDNASRYAQSAKAMQNLVYRLYAAGVPLVAGTDSLAGFGLHRELELYVDAGIPADKVLRLATLGSAEVMSADTTMGSIAVGKQADMILLPADPRQDISVLRQTSKVFKQDRVWDTSALYGAVGISSQD